MDDRVLSPDDARDRLAAWKGRVDKLAADTKDMSDRFQQLQVTKKDRDGLAEVTVDSSGSLVALKLTREIERSSPEIVAATIMSTIRAAKADLAAQTQEIIEDTIGTDSAAGQAIAERVGQHLLRDAGVADEDRLEADEIDDTPEEVEPPAQQVEPPRPESRPTPRARAEEDDDDDNDLNLWR